MRLSQKVAVVGVGTSDQFGLRLNESPVRLQVQAFRNALADAGVEKWAVDGLITAQGAPVGVDYEEFAIQTGCTLRSVLQLWSHGRWASTALTEAAMAIICGTATVVAIVCTTTTPKGYLRHLSGLGGGGVREGFRDVGGGHGEAGPYGLDTPGAATAMVAQRYMELFGAGEEDLAVMPLTFRRHAQLNEMAIMRTRDLSLDEYLASPPLVGPFRLFDYCLRSEGATCLLVTSGDRAMEMKGGAVTVAGVQPAGMSREESVLFAHGALGVGVDAPSGGAIKRSREVFDNAGVERGDIDGLYIYDSFSSNLWIVLERFGFCEVGEAYEFVRNGRIGLGGELPVNTNGGLHSEAHLAGYGHLVEMVRQLRGQCGSRQIATARVLQWATPWGDSVILTAGAI